MIKLSVIMGIYNSRSKEMLKKSIESILNQSYENFEFIICNDGSTNECFEWTREICNNDSRVKFISNDVNRGLAYTLNHCLKEASGEYIARMDDDDCSFLNRFEEQVKFLDTHPEYDLVQCNADVFDENGVWSELISDEFITKKSFLKNNPIIHPCVMVRKRAYDLVDGYRDIPMTIRTEDYDCFMRMFSYGIKMYTIQEKLFLYRNDKTMEKKKKYKYRVNEFKVRLYGYKINKLYPIGFLYALKPLIIGVLPIDKIKKIVVQGVNK